MKPVKHLLTTLLLMTSVTPFAKTAVATAGFARQPVAANPTTAWNCFIAGRFAGAGDTTLAGYTRQLTGQSVTAAPRTPSSDPAWLWAWVLAQGFGWGF